MNRSMSLSVLLERDYIMWGPMRLVLIVDGIRRLAGYAVAANTKLVAPGQRSDK
jgi:hypothetical protein